MHSANQNQFAQPNRPLRSLRHRIRWLAIGATAVLLAACSDPHRGPYHDDDGRTGSDGAVQPVRGNVNCTYELTGTLTTPSRLENTTSACDYRLTGDVVVRDDLLIDPGVTVRAESGASLVVDGGRIEALGTAQRPITFTSLADTDATWGGIRVDSGQRTAMEHVWIVNAAGTCGGADCEYGALSVDNATLSLKYSSIQDSADNGLVLGSNSRLEQFVQNEFGGNSGAPVVLPGHLVYALDTASRYGGSPRANGVKEILVTPGDQTANLKLRWNKLDVPYHIESSHLVSDGTMVVAPGVTILFSRDASLNIRDNGAIEAIGASGQLIEFRGVRNEPGYWAGLNLVNSPWRENILRFVDMLNTGAGTGNASVHLDNSAIAFRNSLISNNTGLGIACEAPGANETASIASIDLDSLISGGIGDHCQVLD